MIDWQQVAARAMPGSRLLRAWALSGGISAHMTGLEVELQDGSRRKLVARVPGQGADPRAAQDGFAVLEWAAGQGLAVPRPVWLDGSGETLGRPGFVMEFVEGQPDFTRPPVGAALESLAAQAAGALARIHQTAVPAGGLPFLARQVGACAELAAAGGVRWALPAAALAGRLRIANHGRENPPALLHGDFWPGNLLWQTGRLAAVVDWEDAALGDPLADFAIARLDFLWIYGRAMFEAFSRRYQEYVALDFSSLPTWDLCAALRLARLVGEDLEGWAAFFAPYGRTDITPASIRAVFEWFVGQASSGSPKQAGND